MGFFLQCNSYDRVWAVIGSYDVGTFFRLWHVLTLNLEKHEVHETAIQGCKMGWQSIPEELYAATIRTELCIIHSTIRYTWSPLQHSIVMIALGDGTGSGLPTFAGVRRHWNIDIEFKMIMTNHRPSPTEI